MSFPVLFQELVDRIVDFLHDDPASLRSCALAHSFFRAPSQFHLFSKVKLMSLASWASSSLRAALHHTPALACYVRELHLWLDYDVLCIHPALGELPRLRILRVDLPASRKWPAPPVLRGFSSATRLVLGLAMLEDMKQLAALVNALPALTELAFSVRVSVKSLSLRGVDPPTPDVRLVYLDLRGIADSQLLDTLAGWLCTSGRQMLSSLQSLYIDMNLVPPATLLQSAASSLRHLLVHYIAGQHGRHFR
jgi:hypothetical protein